MNLRDNLETSFGGLTRHKLRASLTTLGIVFGVGAVIAMQSIGEGARRESLSLIQAMGLDNIIVRAKSLSDEVKKAARSESRGLTRSDLEVLQNSLVGVDALAAKRELKTQAVRLWSRRADARVFGVGPEYARLTRLVVSRGSFFDARDDASGNAVTVIGPKVARALFGFEDPIGRAIKIDRLWVNVVGVLEGRNLSKQEFEGVKLESTDNHVYLPVQTLLRRVPLPPEDDPLSEIVIGLRPDGSGTVSRARPDEIAVVVAETMDRLHRHVDDWELVVPFQLMEQSQKTQRIFNIVMGSIAGISLLVGGIGIMNIMLASVMERTREIGVRRALGARQIDVRTQFLFEALALAATGGALGILFGLGLARIVAAAAGWTTAVSLWSILLAVGVAASVGLVSGIYPAVRAARLDPVQALHYE